MTSPWKNLTASVSTKVFIAFLLVAVAAVTFGGSKLLIAMPAWRKALLAISLGIGLVGAILLKVGTVMSERVTEKAPPAPIKPPSGGVKLRFDDDADSAEEHPLSFLFKLEFWGLILLISALPIY